MRYLGDAIKQIAEVSTNEELNSKLDRVMYNLGFKAPEMHYELWNDVAYALNDLIPNPLE